MTRMAEDSVFGALTERAVRTWQQAHRIIADGEIGPQTAATFGWLWAP